jgi:hypothetical protein
MKQCIECKTRPLAVLQRQVGMTGYSYVCQNVLEGRGVKNAVIFYHHLCDCSWHRSDH